MEREQIREVLKSILEEETGEVLPTLPDNTRLAEQFNFDSVDVVSLIMQVERRFKIRLQEDDLEAVATVASLIEAVQAKVDNTTALEA